MNPPDDTPSPLVVKEASARLRVSCGTVYGLIAAKKLRHVRVGLGRGKILIPRDALEEFQRSATVPVAGLS